MTLRLQVIRVVALLAVVLSLALSPFIVPVAAQAPRPLTNEDMFLYRIAICGEKLDRSVGAWGIEFDAANYQRATANEFSRQEYLERTRAMLRRRFDGLSFTAKFSTVFSGVLGEYSFSDHGFPLKMTSHLRFNIGGASVYGAQPDNVVNLADYRWFVPMDEAAASAFVKSHQDSRGIDRRVLLTITYSIVNEVQQCRPYDVWFKTYFHSVDVFDARNPGIRIAALRPSRPIPTPEQARSEAPEKLRDLLTTQPVLGGILYGGIGVSSGEKITLRIMSFDPGTGSVSAEVDFSCCPVDFTPQSKIAKEHSSRAVGNVSEDTLSLTATWTVKDYFGEVTTKSAHFRLRYNGLTRKLVGPWCFGAKECTTGTASFELK